MLSGTDDRCAYTHTAADTVWECPHPTESDDTRFCPFHRSPEHTTAAQIREAFLDAIHARDEPRRCEFVGATLPGLDLTHLLIDLPNQAVLRLHDAEIHGDVQLDYVTLRQPLDLTEADVDGDITGDNFDADSELRCGGLTTTGDCRLTEGVFKKRVSFDAATVGGDAEFTGAVFERSVSFDDFHITGQFTVEGVQFDRAVSFDRVRFGTQADLSARRYPSLTLKPLTPPDNGVISLTDTEVMSGKLTLLADSVPATVTTPLYDCSRSTLGAFSIQHADSVFPHLRLDHATFKGFDFTEHRRELTERGYDIHNEASGTAHTDGGREAQRYGVYERLYADAASAARTTGASDLATEFAYRSGDQRRRNYREQILSGDTFAHRTSAGLRYLTSTIEALITGYGERPNRVVSSGIYLTLSFGLIYYLLGSTGTFGSLFGALTLSIQTSLTFLLGMPDAYDIVQPSVALMMLYQSVFGFIFFGVIFVSMISDRLT